MTMAKRHALRGQIANLMRLLEKVVKGKHVMDKQSPS